MKTQQNRQYDDASGQELYRPKQGEKMVTVGGYTRDECENLANMVKAAHNKAQHSPLPWSADKWATGYTISATDHSVCHLQDCNNDEANAKLIVRAVNHADKLAACLEQTIRDFVPSRDKMTASQSLIFDEALATLKAYENER